MPFVKREPFEEQKTCNHQEHDPPKMILLDPGNYTWKCPSCGKEQSFVVPPRPTCKADPELDLGGSLSWLPL